ncbi:MAG: DUF2868 domain-containing protein [Desulfofustis sp.]
MNQFWTHADLIDLEYCLKQDHHAAPADLHRRDRQIYLEFTAQGAARNREALIYQWLGARKQQLFGTSVSPGQSVSLGFKQLSFLIIVTALIIGLISGLAFFSYSGTTPVNVLNFLFIFIFSQLLMLIFLVLAAGVRLLGVDLIPAPIVSFYGLLSSWLLRRLRKFSERLPADQVGAIAQLEGLLKKNRSVYAPVFYWPLFRLSQQTMVGFNSGLLIATIFKILTSDIAFGWQSTIQFSTDFIYRAAAALALPWSWLVPPGYAHPSIEQIEGSRIILKDGIFHLQTQDLISWWPFLVFCIFFYGIVIRLLMLLISRAGQYRAMRKLKLNRPALLQLSQRLTTPLLRNQAEPSAEGPTPPFHPQADFRTAPPASEPLEAMLLVPADIAGHYDNATMRQALENSGLSIIAERLIQEDIETDQRLFAEISSYDWPEGAGIIMVMESWMPPIQETLNLVKSIRTAAGAQVPIFVLLIGLQTGDATTAPVAAVDRQVWQQKLDTLGDAYLALLDLGTDPSP